MNERFMKAELGSTPSDNLAGLKAQIDKMTNPPGWVATLVGDVVTRAVSCSAAIGGRPVSSSRLPAQTGPGVAARGEGAAGVDNHRRHWA